MSFRLPASPVARAGDAFAEHLTSRNGAAAAILATCLADLGELRRAAALQRFTADGPSTVQAEWWSPGTQCHVSLAPPGGFAPGDLWFDVLEVTWSIAVPWPEAGDTSWVAIEPTSAWHVRGTHRIDPGVPATPERISGEEAGRYCGLFGKGYADALDWLLVRSAFGGDLLSRLWGGQPRQFGGLSGRVSGTIESLTLADVLGWQPGEIPEPDLISELDNAGLPFRTATAATPATPPEPGELPRNWND